jgi:DNA polymerase (family 10)
MENGQIADILDEIADLLELTQGDVFRIGAYRNASLAVRGLSRRIEDMVRDGVDLCELPHIGKSTAEKINEILLTGTCKRLQDLEKQIPPGLARLMKVPQLGPKRAKLLYDKLKIKSIDELKAACQAHKIKDIPSFGEKTEQKILRGLATIGTWSGRILLKAAGDQVQALGRHMDMTGAIERWKVAGSFRRRLETVGDLDILVQTKDRAAATQAILKYPGIEQVPSRGEERVTVQLGGTLQVDFRFFEPEAFGAALMYFTGSKMHNIAMRKLAMGYKWKLNEYGLFKGNRRLAGATEEEIYEKLGLQWIPPELREDRGEIYAAREGKLPRLIELADIRGDLHCHTKLTDGENTIREMAEAALQRGYEYLAITDHSKAVSVARGLNEANLKKHAQAIRKLNGSINGLWLLAGVEVDILKDGTLDLDVSTLAELDWIVASVHSYFELSKAAMTKRLLKAVRSGVIHCIGHAAGRLIGRRDPVDVDWDELFAACKEYGVLLEINAQPDRLDLRDNYCQRGKEAGLRFVVNTDAHKQGDLDFMAFGVGVARRGWLESRDVLNTLSASELRQTLTRRQAA